MGRDPTRGGHDPEPVGVRVCIETTIRKVSLTGGSWSHREGGHDPEPVGVKEKKRNGGAGSRVDRLGEGQRPEGDGVLDASGGVEQRGVVVERRHQLQRQRQAVARGDADGQTQRRQAGHVGRLRAKVLQRRL